MKAYPNRFLFSAVLLLVGISFSGPDWGAAPGVALTPAEQAFLDAHPTITLGTDATWEPFVIVAADGTVTGYDADILARINDLTGADIRLLPGDWADIQARVRRGEIDGLSTGTVQDERRSYLNFSDVYLSLRYLILVPKGNPLGIRSVSDLEGRSIAIQRGNLAEERIARERFPHTRIVSFQSVDAVIEAVATGRADSAFDNGSMLLYRANRIGSPYLQGAFALDEFVDLVFAVRKDWPELISIINKGLRVIGREEQERLQAHWFLGPLDLGAPPISARLSPREVDFLEQLGPIRLCVDPKWMPIESLTEDGRHRGIIADLVRTLAPRLGQEFQLIQTADWAASLAAIRVGKCDALSAAAITPERSEYLEFTRPLLSEPLVVVVRQDREFDGNFEHYADHRFVMVAAHASIELLRRAHPAMTIAEVPDVVTGLRAVQAGDAFGHIDLFPPVAYAAHQNEILNLKIAGNLPQRYVLAMAARQDMPLLVSSLNKAVASLTAAEIKQARDRWTSVRYEQHVDYGWLWPYVAGGFLLFTAVILWNRRLARLNVALAEANARIESLTITDELTGIPNRRHFNQVIPQEWRRAIREHTSFNFLLIDIDHFKEYNDCYGHQAGDAVLERIGALLRTHCRRGGDFCFRIGGEEFVVLVRTQDGQQAAALAEALRAECEGLAIPHQGNSAASVLTLSIGLLCAEPSPAQGQKVAMGRDWEAIYRGADALLYDAKHQGRNRVVAGVWDPERADSPERVSPDRLPAQIDP